MGAEFRVFVDQRGKLAETAFNPHDVSLDRPASADLHPVTVERTSILWGRRVKQRCDVVEASQVLLDFRVQFWVPLGEHEALVEITGSYHLGKPTWDVVTKMLDSIEWIE